MKTKNKIKKNEKEKKHKKENETKSIIHYYNIY